DGRDGALAGGGADVGGGVTVPLSQSPSARSGPRGVFSDGLSDTGDHNADRRPGRPRAPVLRYSRGSRLWTSSAASDSNAPTTDSETFSPGSRAGSRSTWGRATAVCRSSGLARRATA